MARLARGELFAADEVAVVHVMNRVVSATHTRQPTIHERFGGNRPARMSNRRCSMRSVELMPSTSIVARPMGDLPTSRRPCQRKCSLHLSVRGLKSGTKLSVSGS
jgi:hypothetical protein